MLVLSGPHRGKVVKVPGNVDYWCIPLVFKFQLNDHKDIVLTSPFVSAEQYIVQTIVRNRDRWKVLVHCGPDQNMILNIVCKSMDKSWKEETNDILD